MLLTIEDVESALIPKGADFANQALLIRALDKQDDSILHSINVGCRREVFHRAALRVRFAARNDHCTDQIASHIQSRAAHIEETVDTEDQSQSLYRHMDHSEDHRNHRQRSGRDSSRSNAAQDADADHEDLLPEREVDTIELS